MAFGDSDYFVADMEPVGVVDRAEVWVWQVYLDLADTVVGLNLGWDCVGAEVVVFGWFEGFVSRAEVLGRCHPKA